MRVTSSFFLLKKNTSYILTISEGAEIFRRNASHEIVFRLQKTFFSNVRLKAIGDNTNAADPPQHDVVAPPFHIQLNKSSH